VIRPSSLALLVLAAAACRHGAPAPPAAASAARPSTEWARRTLSRLSLEEKVGQMIGLRVVGTYRNPQSAEHRALLEDLRATRAGILVVFESEAGWLPVLLDQLREASAVPLLVAADFERGASFRVRSGPVSLPSAMAVGATGSEEAARTMGEITARESRALGVHWVLAPVADVNSNPGNPVINVRSFGEDPERVGRMASAFVRGLRAGNVLATAKHFPGHGDTSVDSHLSVPAVTGDRGRLEQVELLPFRRLVAAGVDSVMTGHLAVPAVDPSGALASVSAEVSTRLLREEMGFTGIVATDALDMAGAKAAWQGDAAVRAVLAGADALLLPFDPRAAHRAVVAAVRAGRIPVARIDGSVARLLEAKERLGLPERRGAVSLAEGLGLPADAARAEDIARRSITLVRNRDGALPLRAEQPLRVLHLVLPDDGPPDPLGRVAARELEARRVPHETVWIPYEAGEAQVARVREQAGAFTHVIASSYVRPVSGRGRIGLPESQAGLLRALAADGRAVVMVAYGSPYDLALLPDIAAAVAAYSSAESSQKAAVAALFGEQPVSGRLPVSVPPLYPLGHGLDLPRREMTLRVTSPGDVGFRPEGLTGADRVIEQAVAARAFPGAVVAVGRDGALVHLRAFGSLSYDEGAPPARTDTLYDLASLTKVVVTTTMAMILVDEGKLDLAAPVSAFLPDFRGGDKDRVTVEHLLTHSAGLDWWMPLYRDAQGRDAFRRRIVAAPLAYAPGAKSLYSDLGLFLLGEVLETVAGQPLDAFARARIFEPLGMGDTGFRPPAALLPRIAPTERDPWRGRVVHGEVHDENAFALGGVAAHAGLFGTAPDLARFAQTMLNGGVYDHRRLVSRETVERFTRASTVPGSDRALGWQKPSGENSAGARLSPSAFGHTGFTGTSMWMDPERRLFVILLTNRVHPTRENNAIRQVRRDLADAVVGALASP
jgi:beta-glucosidase-like glycosyl hydrolase/CubicO group peptidase (beta-lactamase class C family)